MKDLNFSPKFKYSMLLYYQIQDIFSIYNTTRELDDCAKMIILVRVGTPHLFFQELNRKVHDRL